MGLIGKEMFAIDGFKLPSNALKEWSGTRADFEKNRVKLEETIKKILERHREHDAGELTEEIITGEKKYVETLRAQVKKIRGWLDHNEDKPGSRGGIRKINMGEEETPQVRGEERVYVR